MIAELKESIRTEELFLDALIKGDEELISMLCVDVETAIRQSKQRTVLFQEQLDYLQKNNVHIEVPFDLPWIEKEEAA